ncbi:hypothetical protein OQA88_3414 [Cercophora sp. LCS_1]
MASCVVREVAWRAPACGNPAAFRPGGRTPICSDHLCRFGATGSTRGPRCLEVPRRLLYSVRDSGGLLPDDTESFFCDHHAPFACRATVEDGTRCPEERRSGTEYCRNHTESVCRAKTRTGSCRSVAMDGTDFCEQHRCANGIGGRGSDARCRSHRTGTSPFCDDHICIWRDHNGVRCDKQSPNKQACCVKHTCAAKCEYGSEDATTRCIYHICAYGRREKSREWPPCEEAVEKEGYCRSHGKAVDIPRPKSTSGEITRPKSRSGEITRPKSRSGKTPEPVDIPRPRSRREVKDVIEFPRPRNRRLTSTELERPRMRNRRLIEEDAIQYGRGSFEDDSVEYLSDENFRPTITIMPFPKHKRSESTHLLKRIAYRDMTDDASRSSRSSRDSRDGWGQEWAIRPWRPWTPQQR